MKGLGAKGSRRTGFTLIELLAVIAIIAVLAALIIGVFPMVNQTKVRSRANAEIAMLTSMIETYKSKKGFYPNTYFTNLFKGTNELISLPAMLYYELTADGNGAPGFVINSGQESKNFAKNLKDSQLQELGNIKFLGIPTKGPDGDFSFWRYDSSSTNRHHQEGFDLWIDVFIKGEKYTFKNWNE